MQSFECDDAKLELEVKAGAGAFPYKPPPPVAIVAVALGPAVVDCGPAACFATMPLFALLA